MFGLKKFFVLNEQMFEHLLSYMLRCVLYALRVIEEYKRDLLHSRRTFELEKCGDYTVQGKCHCIDLYLSVGQSEGKRHHRTQRTLESTGCVKRRRDIQTNVCCTTILPKAKTAEDRSSAAVRMTRLGGSNPNMQVPLY